MMLQLLATALLMQFRLLPLLLPLLHLLFCCSLLLLVLSWELTHNAAAPAAVDITDKTAKDPISMPSSP
jgi:hypothetical protein